MPEGGNRIGLSTDEKACLLVPRHSHHLLYSPIGLRLELAKRAPKLPQSRETPGAFLSPG